MLTPAGPRVLEFNVRFGDPECQPLLARLESDALELLLATATGTLDRADVRWTDNPAVSVVLAAHAYPESPRKGDVITGLDRAEAMPGVTVQHAGTARNADGDIITAGGRVLTVTAVGETMPEARARAYDAADAIEFVGKQVRRDIAG
jgi:phosphoribosylamine--glycine ligase